MARVDKKPTLAGRTRAELTALFASSGTPEGSLWQVLQLPSRGVLRDAASQAYLAHVLGTDVDEIVAHYEDAADVYKVFKQSARMAAASKEVIRCFNRYAEGVKKAIWDDDAVNHLTAKACETRSKRLNALPNAKAMTKAAIESTCHECKTSAKVYKPYVDAAAAAWDTYANLFMNTGRDITFSMTAASGKTLMQAAKGLAIEQPDTERFIAECSTFGRCFKSICTGFGAMASFRWFAGFSNNNF